MLFGALTPSNVSSYRYFVGTNRVLEPIEVELVGVKRIVCRDQVEYLYREWNLTQSTRIYQKRSGTSRIKTFRPRFLPVILQLVPFFSFQDCAPVFGDQ